MKIGIIIETKDYEKAFNGMRFAVTAFKIEHEVKIFLLGDGVEIPFLSHELFNVSSQVKEFIHIGGEILACGTCMNIRNIKESDYFEVSTMVECVNMVEWADRVVTF
ncbi:DsrE family protein [Alkalibaculum sp. M08DMB]|uniref:DsrE family protein n=1 Tax=Alkalibaculum sporogenes TaxID=2655001 RepID=A0A6A7K555_9FIRM|nr:DsrE family protein [Alkalibaculum sporogenes]MPW24387.1 DsrE family protein [Alkalibaculum sporogenes]